MMDTLQLIPADNAAARERFIRFPWRIYRHYPAWVPPLLGERRRQLHPRRGALRAQTPSQLWLARRGSCDVGTLAAFIQPGYADIHGEQAACFGFFEAVPDLEVARCLIAAAAAWGRSHGATVLRGPGNFAMDNEAGLLLNAYEHRPVLLTLYHPPYYRALLEGAGLQKATDWYAYRLERDDRHGSAAVALPLRLRRVVEHVRRRSGLRFRPLDLSQFEAELRRAQQLYNRSWSQNYGFVPMSDSEVADLARSLRPVLDPALVWLAEDGDRPVGLSISLPDINQVLQQLNGRLFPVGWLRFLRGLRHVDALRFFAMGIDPDYRRRGIEAVFYYETFCAAVARGYRWAELSLVVESNSAMRRELEHIGAQIYKTYRIYEMAL